MINLMVNGEACACEPGASLADLLSRLKIDPGLVVVELNRGIVRPEAFGQTRLADGDQLEIIQMMGGG